MKTMKMIVVVLATSTNAFFSSAQSDGTKNSVWVTVNDITALPSVQSNGKLASSDPEFNRIISEFNIYTCSQAFASSRQDELLKVYELECNCNEEELIGAIERSKSILTKPEAGPDYTLLFEPNDYHLAFTNDYALDLINAQTAWDVSMGDTAVQLAITDSNYDLGHEELTGKVSFSHPNLGTSNHYHGTAVAITAAGSTNNALGKSSIGSNCALQLYNMGYDYLLQATYNGAKVINLSWYSGCAFTSYGQMVIDEVYANGSIVVVAAGNGNATCGSSSALVYPAAFNHVISVSSIGPDDNHEGVPGDPASAHQHNDSVDICAPGYNVPLTVSSGWYLTGNGSSFAAPFVTGTIGLMLSINPCLTFEDVEYILYKTAVKIDSLNPQYAGSLGAGRLDAGAALEYAAGYSTINFSFNKQYDCQTGIATFSPAVDSTNTLQSFIWEGGSTDSFFSTTSSGIFSVQVTTDLGCFGTDSIQWTAPEQLHINEVLINPTCTNQDNGSIDLQITGGFAPYTIHWANGNTSTFIENLVSGNYEVSITDSAGCQKVETYTVTEPDSLILNFEVNCEEVESSAASVNLTVVGGTAPYNYLWTNNETTEDIFNLSSGEYSVQVIDANGCEIDGSAIVCASTSSLTEYAETSVTIYPNPSTGQNVTISTNNKVTQINIYNASGQLVQEYLTNVNSLTIETSTMQPGIYYIQCMQEQTLLVSEKLMILD